MTGDDGTRRGSTTSLSTGARVLVVGPPRSGTTWTATVLRQTPDTGGVDEPDLAVWSAHAARVRAEASTPDLGGAVPPGMEALWDAAWGFPRRAPSTIHRARASAARRLWKRVPRERRLTGGYGPPTPKMRVAMWVAVPRVVAPATHQIVRSVAAAFSIGWLIDRYAPGVVVTRRHPLSIVASQLERWNGVSEIPPEIGAAISAHFGVPLPAEGASRAAMTAWLVGAQTSALEAAAARDPSIHTVEHEIVCRDPVSAFRALAVDLGLEWSPRAEEFLLGTNAQGGLGEIRRVWSEQQDAWRGRLVGRDLDDAVKALAVFPVARRYAELVG